MVNHYRVCWVWLNMPPMRTSRRRTARRRWLQWHPDKNPENKEGKTGRAAEAGAERNNDVESAFARGKCAVQLQAPPAARIACTLLVPT